MSCGYPLKYLYPESGVLSGLASGPCGLLENGNASAAKSHYMFSALGGFVNKKLVALASSRQFIRILLIFMSV